MLWTRQRVENRVRFGRIEQQHVIGRSFAPDSIFAFLRWASSDYGTAYSQIDILRAVASGEGYVTAPHVRPSRDSLLRISGRPRVEKVLHAIAVVEALGIDPADVAPDRWRHVHNRLSADDRPQSYTQTRHHAWLPRKRVMR